jgi:mono/diheme cytochrome c family protein
MALLCCSVIYCKQNSTINKEDVAAGKRLYLTYGCAACHGENGAADGPASMSLKTKPRDFRQHENFRNGRSIEAISKTIAIGLVETGMPASPFISEHDRILLAKFIRTLGEVDHKQKE